MATLRPDQLDAHLQRSLAPLYVIHGDEPLLALEAVEQAGLFGRAWDAVRLWIK